MKIFMVAVMVLGLIAINPYNAQGQPAVPFMTGLSATDSSLWLLWLKAGAGVETPVAMLGDPVTVFEPVLTLEPVGLLYYIPSTPFKYVELATLISANNTGVWPHMGGVLHAGPYFAVGMSWDKTTNYFYLSSEEAVATVFNWLGMAGKWVVKKM